ncbi:MAG: hypothetical protein IJ313_09805 [Clostridia bacterium]|nr:hypothetical protein [Clostridia bacterium]
MYRRQMMWQKMLCFLAIAAGAVVFLYALGLMTDLYDSLYFTMMDPSNPMDTWVQGSWIYYDMQPFNRALLRCSIGLLLLACLLFITSTHKRRRYYIGNAVSTFAFAGAGAALAIWCHGQIEAYKAQFLEISFEELEFFAEMMDTPYIDSTFWFDAHYAVFALVLAVSALLVHNFFWKHSLMRAESRLIAEGKRV